MLTIKALDVGYGRLNVLHDLNLELAARGKVVVLGPNGAGKTTLCRAISGLIPVRAGSIMLDGQDILPLSSAQRVKIGIAQVPEGRQIFPRMTVLENLKLGGYVHGAPTAAEIDRAYALFPILHERRDHAGGLLSGGEQQLLALARAIMTRPKLLMLDEPSQGLAPLAVKRVGEAVKAIAETGVAILLVEQNLSLAQAVADEAYILSSGRFSDSGAVKDILSAERVSASYLAGH